MRLRKCPRHLLASATLTSARSTKSTGLRRTSNRGTDSTIKKRSLTQTTYSACSLEVACLRRSSTAAAVADTSIEELVIITTEDRKMVKTRASKGSNSQTYILH